MWKRVFAWKSTTKHTTIKRSNSKWAASTDREGDGETLFFHRAACVWVGKMFSAKVALDQICALCDLGKGGEIGLQLLWLCVSVATFSQPQASGNVVEGQKRKQMKLENA